jgi:hypothetical protein
MTFARTVLAKRDSGFAEKFGKRPRAAACAQKKAETLKAEHGGGERTC